MSRKVKGSTGRLAVYRDPKPMTSPTGTLRLLYCAQSGFVGNIVSDDLFQVLFINLSGGTGNASLISAFRLKKVTMWAPSAGANSGVAGSGVGFAFAGGPVTGTADPRQHSILTLSQARPGMVAAKPSKGTGAAMWLNNTVATCNLIEIISCPIATIIEVMLDVVWIDDGIVGKSHTSVATGAIRSCYYGYLDFSASGGSAKLQPVGVQFLL